MKAVKIIYLIMNIVMILACAALAALGIINGQSVWLTAVPAAAAVLFAGLVLPKSKEGLKKIMRIVLSSHIAVIIALTQAFFVFRVEAVSSAIIIVIAAALIVFMVWSLNRMLKKFSGLGEKKE